MLLIPCCHAQLSVSGGLCRLIEGPFSGFPGYYQKKDNKLGVYDFVAVGMEKTKGVFGTWGEISYLPSSRSIIQVERSSSGGGSSPFYSSYKEYSSRVNFSYLGLTAGVGLVAGEFDSNKKVNFSMRTGAYFKMEIWTHYSESQQEIFCLDGNNNNQWGTMDYEDCSEENPDFKSLNMAGVIQQFGLQVNLRTSYQNFFTDLLISTARYSFSERSTLVHENRNFIPDAERPYLARTFGLKFGWYLDSSQND